MHAGEGKIGKAQPHSHVQVSWGISKDYDCQNSLSDGCKFGIIVEKGIVQVALVCCGEGAWDWTL